MGTHVVASGPMYPSHGPPKSFKITSQRLLDQSQAGVYRGKRHIPPHFGPFWAYLRTLPQGLELLIYPLVKSLFCPINASPKEFWSGPPQSPPLETHFFEVLREVGVGVGGGGGWGGGSKIDPPPFFGPKIMHLLFFLILSRKSVFGSRLHGVCMGRSGTSTDAVYALFSHFCYVCGFGDLGDPVVPTLRGVSTHSEGCEWGCCDSICLLRYERTFFVVCSLAEGRSQPVPKTPNDCFHQ